MQYKISCLGLQSLGFYAEILILAKTFNFSAAYPLLLTPIDKSQIGSFTNKRTIFFKSLTSKSFLPLYMFMDGDMKKNHFPKHWKIQFFVFPLNLVFWGIQSPKERYTPPVFQFDVLSFLTTFQKEI